MKVVIISDSKPGHFNQSLDVSKIISEKRKVSTVIIETKLKINTIRSLTRLYQRSLVKNFNIENAQKIINLYNIKFTKKYESMELITRKPFSSKFKSFSNNYSASKKVHEIKEKLKKNIINRHLSI